MPLEPSEAADFDPETVPTISKLLTELNSNPRGPLQKVRIIQPECIACRMLRDQALSSSEQSRASN